MRGLALIKSIKEVKWSNLEGCLKKIFQRDLRIIFKRINNESNWSR